MLLSATVSKALDVVSTVAGKVSGAKTADGAVTAFKGIPFGAPSVGPLRWKAPQPVAPWDGVRQCVAFGPSPVQRKPAPFSMWSQEFLIPETPIDEDCLYLNVWTAAKSSAEKRPVLVWIYGGGFSSGGSGVPIYDGEAMARKGVTFVSINYRVGALGFLAHPELTRESPHHASGNYGLLDQIAALRWVHENIAAFGGDPDHVTIAGQSAGSMSVNCLVASPLARGLFQRAIGESGASFGRKLTTLDQAEKTGIAAAKSLGATSLAELRAKPAEDLLRMQGPRGPIMDGYVLPDQVAEIFAAGKQNPVDLLTGWNEDEGLSAGPIKTADAYRQQIKDQYGDRADAFLSHYPASNDAESAQSQQNWSRDIIFGAQNYTWANAQARQGQGAVYVYRFTRKVPAVGQYAKYGAFHTGEVPYAYDNLRFVDRPWQPVDRQLASVMSSYWANFVRSGNPNGPALPAWPAYNLDRREILLLGDEVQARPLPDRAALDFLVSLQEQSRDRQPETKASPAPAYPGCVRIFNGKDFEGWEADPSTWSIVDGAMRGVGGTSRLAFTKADYGSFRLIFTARMNPVNGDHLGVLFWGDRPADPSKPKIDNAGWIQFIPPHGAMWDYHPPKHHNLPHQTLAPGSRDFTQWSTTELLCDLEKGTMRAAVDGVEITRYTHPFPAERTDPEKRIVPGPIGLFRHGGGASEYKDVHLEANPKEDRLLTVR